MRKRLLPLLLLLALPVSGTAQAPAPAVTRFQDARLGSVAIHAPSGPPTAIALLISGDAGWDRGMAEMAQQLAQWGALVGGVDARAYLSGGRAAAGNCVDPAADLGRLGHILRQRLGWRDERPPILVGYGSGATLAYATVLQAPPGSFAAALSVGFCPGLPLARPWCPGAGRMATPAVPHAGVTFHPAPALQTPWVVLQGAQDRVCSVAATRAFAAATGSAKFVVLPGVGHDHPVMDGWLPQFRDAWLKLVTAAGERPVGSAGVSDLPLVEVRATGKHDVRMAVLLTGDGGWAGLDRELSARLSAAGIDVVALSTLQYFWTAQDPDRAARDLARIMRHYLAAWHKDEVLLIGYSFGANVLPFLVNRLPVDLHRRVRSLNLLAPTLNVGFEVHVADWIPGSAPVGQPLLPELVRLRGIRTLCLYGDDAGDSPCPGLPAGIGTAVQLPGDHHFNDDYVGLVRKILAFAGS